MTARFIGVMYFEPDFFHKTSCGVVGFLNFDLHAELSNL